MKPCHPLLLSLLTLVLAAAPAVARADDDLVSYALIVGSNAPGPGQTELAFAEDDAREVAAVLRDLGGYPAANVRTLLHPSPTRILEAVAALERAAAADAAAGRRVRLFFYYSGHARASGLSLGQLELPLAELRARLLAVPSTLTLVVLDACQSGAFSRAKGAEPAADFSYNSRTRLDATGVAVLASSTASELSQESDYLRSSYFTHHLLVGLRGAADDNHDGRVSLDEAYRYTYHQTLLATGATAIGGQHVSVEVDLKGQGEIPLSFPERASAALVLPAAAAGHVLIARAPAQAVVAELRKVAGAPLQVAVAAGRYQVLIRSDERVLRCAATATTGAPLTIELADCARERPAGGAAKGGADLGRRWHFALTPMIGAARQDAFTARLEDFGYDAGLAFVGQWHAHALRRIHPHVQVGGEVAYTAGETWRRDVGDGVLTFEANTLSAGVVGRADLVGQPDDVSRFGDRFGVFAELSAGVAESLTTFIDNRGVRSTSSYTGVYASAAVGLEAYVTHGIGLTLRVASTYAPTVDNLIGDQHDVGATMFGAGFNYRH